MKQYSYALALIGFLLTTPACQQHEHEHEHEHEHHHDHETSPSHQETEHEHEHNLLLDTNIVASTPVQRMRLGNVIRTIASIEPAQGDEILLTAKADGIVHLSSTLLVEGTELKAGQTLCSIDASTTVSNNLEAQQRQAEAEFNRAEQELQRMQILREDKLVLQSDLQRAQADYEQSKAALEALKKGFGKGSQQVCSPRNAFVKELLVNNGEFVQTGQILAKLTQMQRLQLKAVVPTKYMTDLKNFKGANLRANNNPDKIWTLEDLNGRLLGFTRQVSLNSPMLTATFEVEANDDLLSCSWVELYIQTQGERECLCVPATALLEDQGTFSLYVEEEPGHYDKHIVKPGATDGRWTEILSGIEHEGARVVSRGAILIKLQQAAAGVDPHSGHSH